jgi:hypothetical protein
MDSRRSTNPRLRVSLLLFSFRVFAFSPLACSPLVIMARISTRANNKDKHPGVVDLSPQRRTHTQKRADDEKAVEEKQAKEDARKAGIRQLANVEERAMQKLKALMAPGSGPRASMTADSLGVGTGKHTMDIWSWQKRTILIHRHGRPTKPGARTNGPSTKKARIVLPEKKYSSEHMCKYSYMRVTHSTHRLVHYRCLMLSEHEHGQE